MRITLPLRASPRLVAGWLVLAVAGQASDEHAVLTAVSAKTAKDYRHVKGPDGRWEREYYAMVNGGAADGTIQDNAQARIQFVAVAAVLAQHLANQGYLPATNPDKVDFLLVVNWGRTNPFDDHTYRLGTSRSLASMNNFGLKRQTAERARANAAAANTGQADVNLTGTVEDMEADASASYLENEIIIQDMMNRSRNQANGQTARLLGYMRDINRADGPHRYAGGGDLYNELVADIEEARYYIILTAYDFQRTVREGKAKLLWETRMSMRAPGNSFAEKAAAMIAYSAGRFGRNTNGLERKLYPQYNVNLEDIQFLGVGAAVEEETEPAETKK